MNNAVVRLHEALKLREKINFVLIALNPKCSEGRKRLREDEQWNFFPLQRISRAKESTRNFLG